MMHQAAEHALVRQMRLVPVLFCVSPPGGSPAGSEPTVESVSAQPIPNLWYYIMAGGGALIVLLCFSLSMVLYRQRYGFAAKKSLHSVNVHFPNGCVTGVEPRLTIKVGKEDYSSN